MIVTASIYKRTPLELQAIVQDGPVGPPLETNFIGRGPRW